MLELVQLSNKQETIEWTLLLHCLIIVNTISPTLYVILYITLVLLVIAGIGYYLHHAKARTCSLLNKLYGLNITGNHKSK